MLQVVQGDAVLEEGAEVGHRFHGKDPAMVRVEAIGGRRQRSHGRGLMTGFILSAGSTGGVRCMQ